MGRFQRRSFLGPQILVFGYPTKGRNHYKRSVFCLWPKNLTLSPPSPKLTLSHVPHEGCDVLSATPYFYSILLPALFLGRCLLWFFSFSSLFFAFSSLFLLLFLVYCSSPTSPFCSSFCLRPGVHPFLFRVLVRQCRLQRQYDKKSRDRSRQKNRVR